MNAFNRAIMSLLALAWIGVLAGILVLVWDEGLVVNFDQSYATLDFDVFANTQAEQILASIVLGALMLPALMLLLFEVKPSPSRRMDEVRYPRDEVPARAEASQHRIEGERRHTDAALTDEAVNYRDRDEAAPRHRRWRFLPGRD
ncbi:MAG: hypothetical protein GEU75_10980 [Dehalococcoidia bacterium]|nr:hypothetical protein [Dehalococcoidia bacterium]